MASDDDAHPISEKEEMDQMIEAYSKMPDSELLNVREVSVTVPRIGSSRKATSKRNVQRMRRTHFRRT